MKLSPKHSRHWTDATEPTIPPDALMLGMPLHQGIPKTRLHELNT
jgi:hypothetical protein